MESDEILRKAWEAVEKSGVPESLQEAAFKEAVAILRGVGSAANPADQKPKGRSTRSTTPGSNGGTPDLHVDEDAFFAQLASESGVDEGDLRDVLNLSKDGKVQVTPPTRMLGPSVSQQARTVISLVASARSKGLGEKPVSATAVREECERKHCYQSNNFSLEHLGRLRGFNAGSTRTEIILTSRWVDEFAAAVTQALGRTTSDDKS